MRVLLVGDLALLWAGIAEVLSRRELSRSLTRATTLREAVAILRRSPVDVVMIQSRLLDGKASTALGLLREAQRDVKVVALGLESGDQEVFLEALDAGVNGFIDGSSSIDDLLSCMTSVSEGHSYIPNRLAVRLATEYRRRSMRHAPAEAELTEREFDVLRLLAQGLTNKAIARQLVVSVHTVRAHLRSIMHKLQAENRVQVVTRATKDGLLADSDGRAAGLDSAPLTA